MRDDEESFVAFASTRSAALRRTAFLLCGDWHQAEDIVQTSLAKLYVVWRKVQRRDAVDAYARRIVVRVFLDERRRGWVREVPTHEVPEPRVTDENAEDRLVLLAALDQLAPRQRAVLVLRFWEDLRVGEVAEALGCTEGTVKSQTSRGLVAIRALVGGSLDVLTPPSERTGS